MKNNKNIVEKVMGQVENNSIINLINRKRFGDLILTEEQIEYIISNELGIKFSSTIGLVFQEAKSINTETVECLFKTEKALKVLDLAAGDGSELQYVINALTEKDFFMVNETNKKRFVELRSKAAKWGFSNLLLCQHDIESFSELEDFFDIVLISTSQEKIGYSEKEQNEKLEKEKLIELKRRFKAGAYLVSEAGHLVVSVPENELTNYNIISKWLVETLEFEEVGSITNNNFKVFKCSKGPLKHNVPKILFNKLPATQVQQLEKWIKPTQYKKHHYFLKNDGIVIAIQNDLIATFGTALKSSTAKLVGIELGIFKAGAFMPSISLAYSQIVIDSIATLDLNTEDIKQLIQNNSLNYEFEEWHLIKYKGINIGWVKSTEDGQIIKLPN